jgi:hypothetical protein
MRKRIPHCRHSRCDKEGRLLGLCEEHYAEHLKDKQQHDEAVYVLHHALLEKQPFQKETIAEEYYRIRGWWNRACNSVNYEREDEILRDEAECALDWCISLTRQLIQEELSYRKGEDYPQPWNSTRDWVWERFANLEKGLMSNGRERTKTKKMPNV